MKIHGRVRLAWLAGPSTIHKIDQPRHLVGVWRRVARARVCGGFKLYIPFTAQQKTTRDRGSLHICFFCAKSRPVAFSLLVTFLKPTSYIFLHFCLCGTAQYRNEQPSPAPSRINGLNMSWHPVHTWESCDGTYGRGCECLYAPQVSGQNIRAARPAGERSWQY